MKTKKQIIKTKQVIDVKRLFINIVLVALSLAFGYFISVHGTGKSFIENHLLSATITLFGFSLSATVFVKNVFKGKDENSSNLISALSKSLKLILYLIVAAMIIEFFEYFEFNKYIEKETIVFNIILVIKTLKYATMCASIMCQMDILNSFVVLINRKEANDKKE